MKENESVEIPKVLKENRKKQLKALEYFSRMQAIKDTLRAHEAKRLIKKYGKTHTWVKNLKAALKRGKVVKKMINKDIAAARERLETMMEVPKATEAKPEPAKKPTNKPQTFKPGEVCPVSGQYKNTTTGKEVTVVKGEPFPPTRKSGQKYMLIDETKHINSEES